MIVLKYEDGSGNNNLLPSLESLPVLKIVLLSSDGKTLLVLLLKTCQKSNASGSFQYQRADVNIEMSRNSGTYSWPEPFESSSACAGGVMAMI